MALITASYTRLRAKAYAGQIADTSLYNIDGTCVHSDEATAPLPIGVLVSTTGTLVEGHKVVVAGNASGQKIVGVAIMSHAYSPTGEYEQGVATNVMTHGRVWALALAAITDTQAAFKNPVSFNADGIVDPEGTVATGFTFTGEVLPSSDSRYKLVKIQLTQDAVAPAAAAE